MSPAPGHTDSNQQSDTQNVVPEILCFQPTLLRAPLEISSLLIPPVPPSGWSPRRGWLEDEKVQSDAGCKTGN